MTNVQQEKWLKVVTTKLMSSEESEGDDIVVHPLLWCSKYVTYMFEKIDAYCTCIRRKSNQAKRQSSEKLDHLQVGPSQMIRVFQTGPLVLNQDLIEVFGHLN